MRIRETSSLFQQRRLSDLQGQSLLSQYPRHAELAVVAVWRLTKERVTLKAFNIFIRPETIDERKRMRSRLHSLCRKRLDTFGVGKDVLELDLVFSKLLVGECDPSEICNFGYVDFDWHTNNGTDAHDPCGIAVLLRGYRCRMLPWPPRNELKQRLPRLTIGLILFGVGVAMQVVSGLGLSPWEVLHQGISQRTGIPLGTVGIITGFIVLILWVPLRERFGIGTIVNVVLIGVVIDLSLLIAPESVNGLVLRSALMVGGILMIGAGTGLYIGAGLGPGPRDGLMTGLARLEVNIAVARFGIEISVLVLGWLLGGTVGIGTALFAFGVGPLVAVFLPMFSVDAVKEEVKETE